jgi:hypothetical protein
MKDDAVTSSELIDQMQALGNKPVVWLGSSGVARDAVRQAVLVDSRLIGLVPAVTQSNVGDVVTTPQITAMREALKHARQSFSSLFIDCLDKETISRNELRRYKGEFDSVIDKTVELLGRLTPPNTM